MGEHLQQLLSSEQAACCCLASFTPKCSICSIPSVQERTKIRFSQVCQASRDGVPTRPRCPRTAGGVGDQEGSLKPPAPANVAAEQSWGTPAATRLGPNDFGVQNRGQCFPCTALGWEHALSWTPSPRCSSLLQTFWGSQLRMYWVKSAHAGHLCCSKFPLAACPGSLLRMLSCGW